MTGTDSESQPQVLCEECEKRPGRPTETDKRTAVMLCSTCFNIRLRRRLSWWRLFTPLAICAFMVPVLALFLGSLSEVIEALRSGTVPDDERTVGDLFANGWTQLTSTTDNLGLLVAILAIAVVLPALLASTVSTGARIAERQKVSDVPNLDDHVRLGRLYRELGIGIVIAMGTAVLVLVVVADTVVDGGPGWATTALLGLLLAVLLIVNVDRIGTFANFAERTEMMLKADIARAVQPRRERALLLTRRQGAIAAIVTSALHGIGLGVACLPQLPLGAVWGLLGTAFAVPLALMIVGIAYPYLRHGDLPSAVIAVSLGGMLGAFLATFTYQVAFVTNPHSAYLWAVLVGSAWYLPLYGLLALGICGIGPLHWLGYFSIKLERASEKFDRAVSNRLKSP